MKKELRQAIVIVASMVGGIFIGATAAIWCGMWCAWLVGVSLDGFAGAVLGFMGAVAGCMSGAILSIGSQDTK